MDQKLIALLRKTIPARIAEELVSVQPINLSMEDLNNACNVLAALHNLNHPGDSWPTSLEAEHKTDVNSIEPATGVK